MKFRQYQIQRAFDAMTAWRQDGKTIYVIGHAGNTIERVDNFSFIYSNTLSRHHDGDAIVKKNDSRTLLAIYTQSDPNVPCFMIDEADLHSTDEVCIEAQHKDSSEYPLFIFPSSKHSVTNVQNQ